MKKQKELLIIMPAYNEEKNIEAVLYELEKPEISSIADILVMNDASSDSTNWVVKAHGHTLVTHVFNLGYGSALQLGIRTDEKQNVEKDADVEDVCGYILEEEWKNFAYTYLASCTGSRAYCSTLFGIVPIKDAAVAEKIAQDIDLVTKDYPAAFGLEEAVRPFRSIMVDAFCQYIPNGESVWKSMHE